MTRNTLIALAVGGTLAVLLALSLYMNWVEFSVHYDNDVPGASENRPVRN